MSSIVARPFDRNRYAAFCSARCGAQTGAPGLSSRPMSTSRARSRPSGIVDRPYSIAAQSAISKSGGAVPSSRRAGARKASRQSAQSGLIQTDRPRTVVFPHRSQPVAA